MLQPTKHFPDNFFNSILLVKEIEGAAHWSRKVTGPMRSCILYGLIPSATAQAGLAKPSKLHSVTCPTPQSPGWRVRSTATRRGNSTCDVRRINQELPAEEDQLELFIISFLLERSHVSAFFFFFELLNFKDIFIYFKLPLLCSLIISADWLSMSYI